METWRTLLCLLLAVSGIRLAAAEAEAMREIEHLLQFVAKSQVHLIRNGKEHTASEGADHLRSKLHKAGGRVKTAEDFINEIATKSSLTGQPYEVKTTDGRKQPSGPWLHEALLEYRAATTAK